MDFSKFSDAEFDVKEWVNGALRAHKDNQTPVDVSAEAEKCKVTSYLASWPEAKIASLHIAHSDHSQAHASTLVMKLQLFIQVLNSTPNAKITYTNTVLQAKKNLPAGSQD